MFFKWADPTNRLGLYTNITQNRLNIFPEILKKLYKYPKTFSKYLEKSSKYLEISRIFVLKISRF